VLENGFTPDGSGLGALDLLSAQLFPRFHGQHAMTAKPSAMQLRRWFIPPPSHSQMIHSSNFEISHIKKSPLSHLIATSDSSTAARAAMLIFLAPWPAIPCLLVCWLVGPPKRREASSPVVAVPLPGPALGWFLRLRLGRHVLRHRHADDVTRDAASRHTTTNYQLSSLYYVLNSAEYNHWRG
jgi:hypothetical protein